MKKTLLEISISIVLIFISQISVAGSLKITGCSPGKYANVTGASLGSKYIGFSAKLSNGKIKDFKHKKVSFGGAVGENYQVPKDTQSVRASTWKGYNKKSGLMESRVDDTGWINCK